MQQEQYRIHGLHCAEEVAVLRREIGGLAGIVNLEFDVINTRMSVSFDPTLIDEARIIAAVAKTGMSAQPWQQRLAQDEGGSWERHGQLILTTSSGILLLLAFLLHALLHGGLWHALSSGNTPGHIFPLPVVLLYALSVLIAAWQVMPKALLALRRLRPDMNLLMLVAVLGAMGIGEWLEAATVAFLFALSLLLEHWSVERARRAIDGLMNLAPSTARLVSEDNSELQELPVEQVPVGARLLIRPGDRVPLDGEVLRGESTLNQAPVTGESMPVAKVPGDAVYAGSVNHDGVLEIRSSKVAADSTLARIMRMINEAQSRRAPSQQWVERFATWYTPLMMGLALLILLLPPLFLGGSWSVWLYRSLVTLVIACPCALVISTPVSVVSALTTAARHGVLIKGGIFLELAGRLRAMAMDKTGTITQGQPSVQKILPLSGHDENELLERAAALETHSEHPLARAILREAAERDLQVTAASELRASKGKGVEALFDGRPFWLGNHRFMHEKGQETPEVHHLMQELENDGYSVVAIGNDKHVCGLLGIADAMRPELPSIVKNLHKLGVKPIVMLTGDNEGSARSIATAAGVDEWRSELLPEDKVAAMGALMREHRRVAMVGDGINDAPAMAAASLGVAMGAMGSDLALETADIALMGDDLSRLPWLIKHSRQSLAIIKQNIVFALGLKALFIALTLLGVASLWLAIVADTGATLLVIANGLRLLKGSASIANAQQMPPIQNSTAKKETITCHCHCTK
jgi:Cd2+/Zn2+-exporting ATPase